MFATKKGKDKFPWTNVIEDLLQCTHSDLVESIRYSKEIFFFDYPLNYLIHLPQQKTFCLLVITGNSPVISWQKLVTNFLEKANIFSDSFSHQCQQISNNNILSLILTYYIYDRSNDINFNCDKILKVIQYLDQNKAHGHDGVSVRTLKLSCLSIIKQLLIIFCNWLKFGNFPHDCKKGN